LCFLSKYDKISLAYLFKKIMDQRSINSDSKFKKDKPILTTLIYLYLSLLLGISSLHIIFQYLPVRTGPPSPDLLGYLVFSIFLILPLFIFTLIGIFGMPYFIFKIFRPGVIKRKYYAYLSIIAILTIVSIPAVGRISWRIRENAFKNLAIRSRPLIDAVKKFQTDNQKPPDKLSDLVPKYIPKIPGTGIMAYPYYEYKTFYKIENKKFIYWWDMGPSQGARFGWPARFEDGDPKHAVLVIYLNSEKKVEYLDMDRMPKKLKNEAFDKIVWASNHAARAGMVNDLIEKRYLQEKNLEEAINLLGEPNGMRAEVPSEWELSVQCTSGGINFDVFFYWPTKKYPQYLYGGSTELIEDWAYVHE
jgi:hypothetical protein